MDTKNQSRFSTLRVFKLSGASKRPLPPPKDPLGPYNITPYQSAGASTSQLTLNTVPSSSLDRSLSPSMSYTMRSPYSDETRFPNPHSPLTPPTPRSASPSRSPPPTNTSAFKKGLTKLSSFGKRPNRSQTAGVIPYSPSMSALNEQLPPESDAEGISGPWNFKHNLHVNGDLTGLPPSWTAILAEAGYSQEEIAALRARRQPETQSSDNPPQFSAVQPPRIGEPSQPTPPHPHPARAPPQFTPSVPASSDHSDIVNPKPRSDSLRRPMATRTASSSALSTLTDVRRSPSPASSLTSSHPATSTYTLAGSVHSSHSQPQLPGLGSHSQPNLAMESSPTSQSPTDSQPQSLSHSNRSRPPAQLQLRTFRVVNEDTTPSSPPPAYFSPTPTGTMNGLGGGQVQRRKSTEKTGLHEPETSTRDAAPEVQEPRAVQQVLHDQEEASVIDTPPPVDEAVSAKQLQVAEEEEEEVVEEGEHDADPSELASPPSPVPRAAALPPRLSLHTDQDDGWGDMFSFLPSTRVSAASKRLSGAGVGCSTSPTSLQSKRASQHMSISASGSAITSPPPSATKRRSKRFSNTLAIVPPTNYVHAIISSPPSESLNPSQAPPSQGASSAAGPSPSYASSPIPPQPVTEVSQSHYQPSKSHSNDSEPSTSITIFAPARSTIDIGVLTPDPAYPIAESPLWQEVRALVRDAKPPLGVRQVGLEGGVREEATGTQELSVPSSEAPLRPPSLDVGPQAPFQNSTQQLSSRFSDASSFQGNSRFSEATSFQGRSRFSDATSFHGHSRFSEVSIPELPQGAEELKSRFSAWSTASNMHGHPSTLFSPMEAMPEGPYVSQTRVPTIFPPPRKSSDLPPPVPRKSVDLPPPLPPPKDDLPPPPIEAEDESPLSADESRVSHISSVSNASIAQIHGAKIALRTQANVLPAPMNSQAKASDIPVSISTSPPQSTSSKSTVFFTPVSSPQTHRPPPLPLPPLGKVLPSLIAGQRFRERRRRRHAEGSQDSTRQGSLESEGEVEHSSPASGSSSSHSHSTTNSAESGVAFGSSFGHGEGDPRCLSASASSYEEPPKSPMLAYLEDEQQRSPKPMVDVVRVANGTDVQQVQSDDDDDTIPLGHLHRKSNPIAKPREEDNRSPENNGVDILDEWLADEQGSPEHAEMESSLVESPGVYDHGARLGMPAITVNGLNPSVEDEDEDETRSELESQPEPTPEDAEEESVPRELPLVLVPLQEYIYMEFDPFEMFTDLQEVAQGQYGSVYAAHVASSMLGSPDSVVAVKKVPIPKNGTPKIGQLRHELSLMSQVRHKHILAADGLFFDFTEDMLWIRMELMERSLADVLVLSEEGLELEEQVIARFASDALLALAYLSDLGIAHRDVRSDNLLISGDGVLKLADFSNGVRVSQQDTMRFEIVGVHHWQAPEVRSGRYDATKVDVWSLGATVWEAAEGVPPFADIEDMSALSDRWPPLSQGDTYSYDINEFLRLCSEPPTSRPPASQLLHDPFIQQACPRDQILQVLNVCHSLEETLQRRSSEDSQGTLPV